MIKHVRKIPPFLAVALLIAVGAGCFKKNVEDSNGNQNNNKITYQYIVTSGSRYDKTAELLEEWFSIYGTDGTLIKKLEFPRDDVIGAPVESIKPTGESIYYIRGSKEKAYISVMSPETGKVSDLSFTETVNEDSSKNFSPIKSFEVSSDEKYIAWKDAVGKIYISQTDGADKREISVDGLSILSLDISHFSGDSQILYLDDFRNNNLIAVSTATGDIIKVLANIDYHSAYSPTERFAVTFEEYSDCLENAMQIMDAETGKSERIPFSVRELVLPREQYMYGYAPFVAGFSSNESKILFGFGSAWYEWAGTFLVDVSGENLELIFKDAEPIEYLTDSLILIKKVDGGIYLAKTDGEIIKEFTDDQFYYGLLKMNSELD